jgi:hypothetical protein
MEKKKPKYTGDDPKGVTVPRLRRTPKIGDRVGFADHTGVFVVLEVHQDSVKLQALKGGPVEAGIPWSMLVFLDEEDASQAAARIVREATEH